jgi:diacylglycerol kinase (ATP)
VKATVIYNPAAGQRDDHGQLQAALRYLTWRGWTVSLEATLGRGDATTYARQAVVAGDDAVVVAGGDGSINEAVQALAHSGTALGVLPRGTGNVWAREVGIPLHNPSAAAEAMVHGQVRTVDLGMAGDRFFLMWAGIGFDASLVRDLEEAQPEFKRQWGMAAFLVRGTALDYHVNGRRIRRRTIMAVLANGRRYAAYLELAPNARLDDGLLDFYIFKGKGWLYTLRHFAGVASHLHVHDPEVEYFQVERLGVRGRASLPVHTDGEPAGETPMEFRVAPAALHVIVP